MVSIPDGHNKPASADNQDALMTLMRDVARETRDNAKETRELKETIVGSMSQRGLVHRVEDTEKFIGGFKKYALIFVIAVSTGQPLVDRALPGGDNTATTNSETIKSMADLLQQLVESELSKTPGD